MLEKITVFDVETPSRRQDRICAIGLARIENGVIVDRKYSLVDPQCEFDAANVAVHGITEADVIGAPTFAELWNEIEPWFLDGAVAAHNAGFDIAVLRKTLKAYGIPFPKMRYMDTMTLAPEFWADLPDRKLDTICEYLGIEIDHHNAGSDALATAEVVTRMLAAGLDERSALKTSPYTAASEGERVQVVDDARARAAATRQLREIVNAAVKDRTITAAEYEALQAWVSAHEYLQGSYPYDDIKKKIAEIERNGVRESTLDDLCDLCVRLLDPVTYLSNAVGNVDVSGKNVVLTGNFHHGDEAKIISLVTKLGGNIQDRVTHATDVVLVGGLGHEKWAMGSYGRKIEHAMQLQAKGLSIEIVPEESVLGKVTRKAPARTEAPRETRRYEYPEIVRTAPPQEETAPKKKKPRGLSIFRICFGVLNILLALDGIGTDSFLVVLSFLLLGGLFFVWQFWREIKSLWK